MMLPLHIFEERYKRMIADCLAGDPRFGVALISKGAEVGAPARVHGVGSIARIIKVGRYEDGRMDLMTVGLQRFRAVELNEELPYLRATVELLDDSVDEPEALRAKARAVHQLLEEYRGILGLSGEDAPWVPDEAESLSYVAGVLDLPLPEKQRLIETSSTSERLSILRTLLRREIQLLKHLGPTRPVGAPHRTSPS